MLVYERFSQLKVISYARVTSLSSKSHAGILNFRRTVFCPNWSFLRCPTISILWRAPLYLRGCTVNHLRSTSQAFCQISSGIPSTSPKRMFSIGPHLIPNGSGGIFPFRIFMTQNFEANWVILMIIFISSTTASPKLPPNSKVRWAPTIVVNGVRIVERPWK